MELNPVSIKNCYRTIIPPGSCYIKKYLKGKVFRLESIRTAKIKTLTGIV